MRAIRGIIWDNDGTLYRHAPGSEATFLWAAAQAALDLGVPMSLQQARDTSRESYQKYHHTWAIFERDYGVDPLDFHLRFHARAVDIFDQFNPIRFEALPDSFATSSLQHVVLTQAARSWASRMLQHIDLSGVFPDDRIVAYEDVRAFKSQSPAPFLRALDVLGMDAGEVLVVEDSPANLVHAHALGLRTALVHHGAEVAGLDHIHHYHDSPVSVLKALQDAALPKPRVSSRLALV